MDAKRNVMVERFLAWLAEYRVRNRLSVRALAAKTGVSLPTLYRLVHRANEPKLSTLERLCDSLGVDLERILEGEAGGKP